MDQPYGSADAAFAASAAHISAAKAGWFRAVGLPLVMGERDGAVFTDAYSGARFFNCHSNGGLFNLGHRNPRVIAAVTEALDSVDVGNHHLVSGHRAHLAERLAATTDGALPKVVFGGAGTEVMDAALKAVRAVTGRTTIVSVEGAYHGHTGLAVAASDPTYRDPFGIDLPGFVQVPFDDLAALDAAIDADTAAVLIEPIPATLGMPVPSDGYLEGIARICADRGAMLVLDEVQTGLGRTGEMWAYRHFGITPDVLITGKGLSGGIYPMAAALMSEEVHRVFEEHPFVHFSTYGGAEPGCAAALSVLDITEAPGFLEQVRLTAERFEKGFIRMPFEFRGLGLMRGLGFAQEGAGMMAVQALIRQGVFVVFANHDDRAVQFLPPLILSDDETDEIVFRVETAFG
jgi:acetylornithine/succinyldiaminopimelate/putrescine aminotransferase